MRARNAARIRTDGGELTWGSSNVKGGAWGPAESARSPSPCPRGACRGRHRWCRTRGHARAAASGPGNPAPRRSPSPRIPVTSTLPEPVSRSTSPAMPRTVTSPDRTSTDSRPVMPVALTSADRLEVAASAGDPHAPVGAMPSVPPAVPERAIGPHVHIGSVAVTSGWIVDGVCRVDHPQRLAVADRASGDRQVARIRAAAAHLDADAAPLAGLD